jgi:hypothetical protein
MQHSKYSIFAPCIEYGAGNLKRSKGCAFLFVAVVKLAGIE